MRRLHRQLAFWLAGAFAALGVMVALLLPPFYVPDERGHWLTAQHRIAQLTGGATCSLDVALAEHFRKGVRFRPNDKLARDQFSRVDGLTPACESRRFYPYGSVLSTPGVLAGRGLRLHAPSNGADALAGFFAARLLQGALVAALVARLALLGRGVPGLLIALTLLLSPLFVQQAFGITPDALCQGFAIATAAWLAFPDRWTRWDSAALLALGLVAMTTKPVLAPVLPAALGLRLAFGAWLARESADSRWAGLARAFAVRRADALVALGLASLGLAYLWTTRAVGPRGGAGHAEAQLAFAREQPGVVWNAIAENLAELFADPGHFAGPLGYLDTALSETTLLQLAALLALALVADAALLGGVLRRVWRDPARRAVARRWLPAAMGMALLLVAALATSVLLADFKMYLTATPLRAAALAGVQPRYFLPHLALLMGALLGVSHCLAAGDAAPPARLADEAALPGAATGFGLGLEAALLVGFAAALAADLLRRYG